MRVKWENTLWSKIRCFIKVVRSHESVLKMYNRVLYSVWAFSGETSYFSFCSTASKQTINRKKAEFPKKKKIKKKSLSIKYFGGIFCWEISDALRFFFSFKTCSSKEQTDSSRSKYLASTYLQSSAHELPNRNDTAIVWGLQDFGQSPCTCFI